MSYSKARLQLDIPPPAAWWEDPVRRAEDPSSFDHACLQALFCSGVHDLSFTSCIEGQHMQSSQMTLA